MTVFQVCETVSVSFLGGLGSVHLSGETASQIQDPGSVLVTTIWTDDLSHHPFLVTYNLWGAQEKPLENNDFHQRVAKVIESNISSDYQAEQVSIQVI